MQQQNLFKELRDEFRKWYSLLSVQEITCNKNLMNEIIRVEQAFEQLISQGA